MLISKEVQGEILAPIIFHRERDEIGEPEFHHLVGEILKVCPEGIENQHRLVGVAIKMVERDIRILPHERPPGTPGSVPMNPYKVDEQADPGTWIAPICTYLTDHPEATIQEIAMAIGVNNERTVFELIQALMGEGLIIANTTFSAVPEESPDA